MAWGDKHHYMIYCWGENRCIARFSTYEDALEHKEKFMKPYQSWNIYRQDLRVLGYVRKEVLDLCRHTDNTSSLTVVPVAPKAGNWVPIYVEGESEC